MEVDWYITALKLEFMLDQFADLPPATWPHVPIEEAERLVERTDPKKFTDYAQYKREVALITRTAKDFEGDEVALIQNLFLTGTYPIVFARDYIENLFPRQISLLCTVHDSNWLRCVLDNKKWNQFAAEVLKEELEDTSPEKRDKVEADFNRKTAFPWYKLGLKDIRQINPARANGVNAFKKAKEAQSIQGRIKQRAQKKAALRKSNYKFDPGFKSIYRADVKLEPDVLARVRNVQKAIVLTTNSTYDLIELFYKNNRRKKIPKVAVHDLLRLHKEAYGDVPTPFITRVRDTIMKDIESTTGHMRIMRFDEDTRLDEDAQPTIVLPTRIAALSAGDGKVDIRYIGTIEVPEFDFPSTDELVYVVVAPIAGSTDEYCISVKREQNTESPESRDDDYD